MKTKQLIEKLQKFVKFLLSLLRDYKFGISEKDYKKIEKFDSEISALESALKQEMESGEVHYCSNCSKIVAGNESDKGRMTVKEFRTIWLKNNPNTIHIPSEHELGLMEAYAQYHNQYQVENKGEISKTCQSCKHFGAQGRLGGLKQNLVDDNRPCSAYLFGDDENEDFRIMPDWVATFGSIGYAKGVLKVHKDFGCINHNSIFENTDKEKPVSGEEWKEKWEIAIKQKIELQKQVDNLTQRLIDAGLEKPAIIFDASHKA
jgi:hypothetical protein